jgi:hypothetical protein
MEKITEQFYLLESHHAGVSTISSLETHYGLRVDVFRGPPMTATVHDTNQQASGKLSRNKSLKPTLNIV